MCRINFQMLKLSNTLNLIETPLKKTKYTDETLKKSHKNTNQTFINKESGAKLKRKAAKELVDIIDNVVDYSDAETISHAEPYRDTSKKDGIYRRKAIQILNKKRKLTAVADSSDEEDNASNPRTRKQLKEKAVARANSALVQSNLGIDLENLVDVPLLFNLRMTSEMEIEDWLVDNLAINNDECYIEHKQGINVFRVRKELDTESNNSEMVLNNITINIEDFINIPLLFDLNKTLESEIKNWIVKNRPINSKEEYYIEHKKGSNLFIVRNTRTNSEVVKAKAFINPEEYLNVPLRFDLDETSESEIEKWIVKSIKYWITRNADNTRYYIDHVDGSDVFIITRE